MTSIDGVPAMQARPIVVQLQPATYDVLLEVAARRGVTAAALAPDLLGAGLAFLLRQERAAVPPPADPEPPPALPPPEPDSAPIAAIDEDRDPTDLERRTVRGYAAAGLRPTAIAREVGLPIALVRRALRL